MNAARMYAEAWLAGDLAAIIDMYADDFVLHYRTGGGKLTECWVYDEDQRAIDALWSA